MTELTQCSDCGLLGIRPRDRAEELHSFHIVVDRDLEKYRSDPLCAVGNCEFSAHKIDDEWKCRDFIQYQPGLTPREHIAMGILADFRAISAKQEADMKERAEREQKWREDQSERADKARLAEIAERQRLHEESLAEARRIHWRELVTLGAVVTLLSVGATIAAAFIERNSWFRDSSISPSPPALTVESTIERANDLAPSQHRP